MTILYNHIKHVLPEFAFEGRYLDVEELNSGIINNTYRVIYALGDGTRREYALQHINGYVFRDPEAVMRNIERVTDFLTQSFLREGTDPRRRVLRLTPTHGGGTFFRDRDGGVWRAYDFITRATAYDRPRIPAHFYECGRGFGEFQRRLCDFDAAQLVETIPDFHNTTRRFYTFVQALAQDKAGRARGVEAQIDFLFDRRRMMNEIVKKLDAGELPTRVTHNDTKINNVMLDDETGRALCVIDLDTVMPGSPLYDFGDAVRFGASTAAEDEPDTRKIALDMEKYALFTRGFLQETRGVLQDAELRLLPLGVKVITCELAMRFLTDYLDGDLYFKVRSPEHNLIRARAQMALLMDIEKKEGEMTRIICDALAAR